VDVVAYTPRQYTAITWEVRMSDVWNKARHWPTDDDEEDEDIIVSY
jgi:hypothetical protein